jgi:hypothetical protein
MLCMQEVPPRYNEYISVLPDMSLGGIERRQQTLDFVAEKDEEVMYTKSFGRSLFAGQVL